jgi:hypothetical protein
VVLEEHSVLYASGVVPRLRSYLMIVIQKRNGKVESHTIGYHNDTLFTPSEVFIQLNRDEAHYSFSSLSAGDVVIYSDGSMVKYLDNGIRWIGDVGTTTSVGMTSLTDEELTLVGTTHRESMGNGFSVTMQYCEHEDCGIYLGVNYPSSFCDAHRNEPSPEKDL